MTDSQWTSITVRWTGPISHDMVREWKEWLDDNGAVIYDEPYFAIMSVSFPGLEDEFKVLLKLRFGDSMKVVAAQEGMYLGVKNANP